jgi:hypothetical protein
LLDQSVDDARHAELSDPAVRLRDFDAFDRLRLVGSFEQLRPNAWPLLTQVVPGVADYDDDSITELTMIIAWENASSRFNRAFRIPSQGFWKR